jgi:hypothetical protein
MEIGIHLTNAALGPGKPPLSEQVNLDRVLRTGVRSFLLYISWLPDTPAWAAVADEIRRRVPGARIHVRFEKRGKFVNPQDEATIFTYWAGQINADTYRWRNEDNLIQESDSDSLDKYVEHLFRFGRTVKVVAPYLASRTYISAISWSGRSPEAYLAEAVLVQSQENLYAGIDGHFYGDPGRIAQDMDRFRASWKGPSVVTESNFGSGNLYDLDRYAREVPGNAQAAADRGFSDFILFIAHWENPDIHQPTTTDVFGTPLEAALPTMKKTYSTGVHPVAVLTFERGFKTFATALKLKGIDPGIPLYAPERYAKGDNDGFEVAYQETTTGYLEWNRKLNDMFWVGRDRKVVAYNGGLLKVAK